MDDKRYETERLFLRPVGLEDAAFIVELMNTPGWLKNIGDRNVHTEEDAKAYIREKMLPQLTKLGYGNYLLLRKEDQASIGTCGLYDRKGLEGVDIGFALLPQFERMGYALEGAQKVKELAVSAFGIDTISGITLPSNKPSQNLLKKLGLQFIKNIHLPDDEEELMLFRWSNR